MKLAITAQDTDLNAPIETRFGRARYLLIVDSESGSLRVHDKAENADGLQGAGIQSAQAAVKLGAQALLTGHVGPKALETLQAAGIAVCVGATGTVAETIEAFHAGKLDVVAESPTTEHAASSK
jgi:predicted Fe-Mo cluster-binding NifX family protein